MFYHRTLPPPLPSSASRRKSSSSDSSDLPPVQTGEEDSMTTLGGRSSFLPYKNINHIYTTQEDKQQNKPLALSRDVSGLESQRLSSNPHNSNASQSDIQRGQQSPESKLPSISREGDLSFQDSPPHLCLCQPDPKVPRPRNAFILFRQHHQAAVVSQHPGLANPDISKIIGDAWRSSSTETKDHWKKLAEEEKVRHQKLYPDYRYQPRRPGRNSLTNSAAIDPGTHLCLKCGGKSMQTSSALMKSEDSPRTTLPGPSMNGNTILSRGSHYIGSPSFPPGPSESRWIPPKDSLSALSLRQRDTNLHEATESKKRKYDDPNSSPTGLRSPLSYSARRPSIPYSGDSTRGPNTSVLRSPKTGTRLGFTPGPVLPPLQIDKTRELASHSQAIEAMVMGIPALMKIKVLARISPPLAAPSLMSPAHDTRGALIAVDGADKEAVESTTNYLKDYLERDGDYKVRLIWQPVIAPAFKTHISWLDTIRAYHDESANIVKYMTTFSVDEGLTSKESAHRAPDESINARNSNEDHMDSSPMSSFSHTSEISHKINQPQRPIPIVIAPFYQLSLTNLAASQIPINDEYAPTDHWQWMATLWRGIVGPDVTIDIQHPGSFPGSGLHGIPSPGQPSAGPASGQFQRRASVGNPAIGHNSNVIGAQSTRDVRDTAGPQPPASAGNMPLVDVRLQEARAVFLRGEANGRVSETGLRRTGFEVGEWLRDIDSRERNRAKRDRART